MGILADTSVCGNLKIVSLGENIQITVKHPSQRAPVEALPARCPLAIPPSMVCVNCHPFEGAIYFGVSI